eukprot:1159482-Pelagomonas_calceolata.AAC.3
MESSAHVVLFQAVSLTWQLQQWRGKVMHTAPSQQGRSDCWPGAWASQACGIRPPTAAPGGTHPAPVQQTIMWPALHQQPLLAARCSFKSAVPDASMLRIGLKYSCPWAAKHHKAFTQQAAVKQNR